MSRRKPQPEPDESLDRLVKTPEACRILKMPRQRLYQVNLPWFNLGKGTKRPHRWYKVADLNGWIDAQRGWN
jgi:arginine utilization protein RocB